MDKLTLCLMLVCSSAFASDPPSCWLPSNNDDWFRSALERNYQQPKKAIMSASQKADMARRIDRCKYLIKRYKGQLSDGVADARYRQALINTIEAKQIELNHLQSALAAGSYVLSHQQANQVAPGTASASRPVKSIVVPQHRVRSRSGGFWWYPSNGRVWAGSSVNHTLSNCFT